MSRLVDLTGQKIGAWTVEGLSDRIVKVGKAEATRRYWWCVCECGTRKEVLADSLRRGESKSCGCTKSARVSEAKRSKARHANPVEYRIWQGMKARCFNPNYHNAHRWGGRGITVDPRWVNSFETFLADVGPRPSSSHSLDRINNDGNYEPGNVRWATRNQQQRNMSRNRLIAHDGQTKTLVEWAETVGLPREVIKDRIGRYGWPVALALTAPSSTGVRFRKGKEIAFRGETRTIIEWAKHLGLDPGTINSRLNYGWSIEKALTEPLDPKRGRRKPKTS